MRLGFAPKKTMLIARILEEVRRRYARKRERRRRRAIRRVLLGGCLFGGGVVVGLNYPAIRDYLTGKLAEYGVSHCPFPPFNANRN